MSSHTIDQGILDTIVHMLALKELSNLPKEESDKIINCAQKHESRKLSKKQNNYRNSKVTIDTGTLRLFAMEEENLNKNFYDFRRMMRELRQT